MEPRKPQYRTPTPTPVPAQLQRWHRLLVRIAGASHRLSQRLPEKATVTSTGMEIAGGAGADWVARIPAKPLNPIRVERGCPYTTSIPPPDMVNSNRLYPSADGHHVTSATHLLLSYIEFVVQGSLREYYGVRRRAAVLLTRTRRLGTRRSVERPAQRRKYPACKTRRLPRRKTALVDEQILTRLRRSAVATSSRPFAGKDLGLARLRCPLAAIIPTRQEKTTTSVPKDYPRLDRPAQS